MAWATVLEYSATTFGVEKVPLLLSALPEHERWEMLIPAVFDLPLAEFESGWHAYLADKYHSDIAEGRTPL